jgi:hypothetical protein
VLAGDAAHPDAAFVGGLDQGLRDAADLGGGN